MRQQQQDLEALADRLAQQEADVKVGKRTTHCGCAGVQRSFEWRQLGTVGLPCLICVAMTASCFSHHPPISPVPLPPS
jgi:hypothetical protein